MMRLLNLLLLSAVCAWGFGCSSSIETEPQSELNVLLKKIEQAVDPDGVGRNIRTMRFSATSELVEQKIKIQTVITYRFPNEIKEQVRIGEFMEVTNIYDGKNGTEITKGMGVRALSEAEMNSKKFEVMSSNPQLPFDDIFDEIILAPEKAMINGKPCYHLTGKPLKSLGLSPVQMYFDAETYRMARQDFIAPTAMGNVPMSTDTYDYRKIDGLYVSLKATSKFLGTTMNTVIEKVELNPSLGPDEFQVPDEDD
jgi:hypothetical protein